MIEVNNKNDMNGKLTQKLYSTNYNGPHPTLKKKNLIFGLVILYRRPFKIHICSRLVNSVSKISKIKSQNYHQE